MLTEALSKNIGTEGFSSPEAMSKASEQHHAGLKDRPDYDGKITLGEANSWYRNGNGESLFAD